MKKLEKEQEELKASSPKVLLMKKIFNSVLSGSFYSQTPFTNYQNNKINTITMGANRGDNQKVTKRGQKSKAGIMNSG